MMRAALVIAAALGCACAPHDTAKKEDPGPSFPAVAAYPAPAGTLGNPDDRIVQVSASGQWLDGKPERCG